MEKRIIHFSIGCILICVLSCNTNHSGRTEISSDSAFSLVFMTDIHLQPELNAVEGFRQAMDTINKLNPELVISGGDLIMDALGQKQSRADSLYELFNTETKKLKMPVHHTIGNHELFGVYTESGVDTTHALYADKMFRKAIGDPFYSFTHKHWKFFVLNSIVVTNDRKYTGEISADQLEWLRKELAGTDVNQPLAIITHIPFLSSLTQYNKGATEPNSEGLVVKNSRTVLDLFKEYNLKLVLQGHLHVLEDNYIKGVHFITGGAVCGGWWQGPHEGTEEGFLHLHFNGDNVSWKYIDYGWNPQPKNSD